jgi:hypothetical protein
LCKQQGFRSTIAWVPLNWPLLAGMIAWVTLPQLLPLRNGCVSLMNRPTLASSPRFLMMRLAAEKQFCARAGLASEKAEHEQCQEN